MFPIRHCSMKNWICSSLVLVFCNHKLSGFKLCKFIILQLYFKTLVGSRIDSVFLVICVIRTQFHSEVGLRSVFSCWLSADGHSQGSGDCLHFFGSWIHILSSSKTATANRFILKLKIFPPSSFVTFLCIFLSGSRQEKVSVLKIYGIRPSPPG